MKAFRCPHCGGESQYDPKDGKIICEYCDSVITVEEYQNETVRRGTFTVNELTCSQCGAVIYSTDNTVATFCSYCGSSVLLESRIVEEKRPNYIIPFKIKQEHASGLYRDKIHRILLAPDWMEEEATVEKFRGIYMPYHLFRFTYDGTWEGEGTNFRIETENRKKYDVTRTYHVGTSVAVDYKDIPVDASASFPDGMGRAVCPYYAKDMVEFKEPYLAGFYADRADVDPEIYMNKYETLVKMDMSTKKELSTGGISVPTGEVMEGIELKGESSSALFPVWFMSHKNKDKISYAAINGATGEVVADIPIDFKKYLVAGVIVAGLFSIILNFFIALTPNKLMTACSILSLIMFFVANKLYNQTYRRSKHLDDAGYIGKDQDKLRKVKVRKIGSSIAKIVVTTIAIIFFSSFLMMLSDEFLALYIIISTFLPLISVGYIVVSVVRTAKGSRGVIKRKNAPWYYKLLVIGKPLLAMLINLYIAAKHPVEDIYYYVAAIIGIVLLILTAFDLVRAQNKYTMRDLPLFTEKRGGE